MKAASNKYPENENVAWSPCLPAHLRGSPRRPQNVENLFSKQKYNWPSVLGSNLQRQLSTVPGASQRQLKLGGGYSRIFAGLAHGGSYFDGSDFGGGGTGARKIWLSLVAPPEMG